MLGIPFDLNAKPATSVPQAPRQVMHVLAIEDREALEIRFPRVQGYPVEMPREHLQANFNEDSHYSLRPEDVGPIDVRIVGEGINLTPGHLRDARFSTIVFKLVRHMLNATWRDAEIERPDQGRLWRPNASPPNGSPPIFHPEGGVQSAQILDPPPGQHLAENYRNHHPCHGP